MAKGKARPKSKSKSRTRHTAKSANRKTAKPKKAPARKRAQQKGKKGEGKSAARKTAAAKKAVKKPSPKPKKVMKPKPAPKAKTQVKTKPKTVPAPAVKTKKPVEQETAIDVATKNSTAPRARRTALDREFLMDLASSIRNAVLPAIDAAKGREVIGNAASGDATFQLDRLAEKALLVFLRDAKLPVAYYSEDSGYTTFTSGQPEHLLVVDPIDGTRAAKSGFEWCVVSIGSTRVIERPYIGDIDTALVMELMGPRTFYAERGKGARLYIDGQYRKPRLSRNAELETVVWSMTVPARPAELIFPTAAKLIDLTSLKGGFYACNSTSYSLTRLLTDQLDACIDIANRYYRDIPEVVQDQFINAGRGAVLGIAPYDIAASLLIAEEAGCIVTDAYGKTLRDVLLLDSATGNHRSMVAAANAELHEKLLSFFDTRIRQYEQLLERRAELSSS